MLLGRSAECRRIDALLERARGGESAVLVVRGEPGIGKTALLEYAAGAAGEAVVMRARGVESEVELPFAGLHELLRPLLDAVENLPPPQTAALRGALGLAPAGAAEAHLVGAATLALLADACPVLVLIDDLQWLDAPSAGAVVFAARRLLADQVAVVLAVRAGEPSAADGAGLPELELSGLAPEPARELLGAHAGRPVSAETAAWLHAATGGNPLALVELAPEAPRLRPTPVGLEVPVGERIERALGRRLDGLSAAARASLLAAAVADDENLGPVLAAAAELGGSLAGLEEAESARLVTVSAGRIAFRHPLVRSLVLAAAEPAARRATHRAYAAALGSGDDRRVWHAAAGAVAPDEAVAAPLAAAGARAGGRSGHGVAAAAFEQAARLTPAAALRAERLRAAAEAAWLGGDADRALALLAEAAPLAGDAPARATIAQVRGRVLARHGPIPDAVRVLCEAADAIADSDPARASEMLAEASYAAGFGSAGEVMVAAARRAVELAPAEAVRARCMAATALGAALVLTGADGATEWLREAARLIDAARELRDDAGLAAWLGVPAAFLRGGAAEYEPLRAGLAAARASGAVGALPFALFKLGVAAASADDWDEAAAAFAEALRLSEEVGLRVDYVAALAGLARLQARRGRPQAAATAADAVSMATELGMPFFAAWGHQARGDRAWAAGDVDGARAAFTAKAAVLAEHELRDADLSPAPELVELHVSAGHAEEARRLAAEAAAQARAKGRPWALARAARAEALVTDDDGAALARFADALALHEKTSDTFEAARTRLCLGERLRRGGRRAEARLELRAALAAFEGLRAAPWAERAAAELKATGETVRRRDPATLDDLTPQELRIALMLSDGTTVREAAAALYLSPKTVEYHLRNAYLKLGVNSRERLAAALGRGQSSRAISSAARPAPSPVTGR
jgi:DNA-binding CsgD family transcriptional regulator